MPTEPNIPPGEGGRRVPAWLFPLAAVALVALLYSASLEAPFHFDDDYYVLRNEPIRNLAAWRTWPWAEYSHRVLYELSLGLNMALGGTNPWGYHLFNIAGHLLAVVAVWLLTARLIRGTRYESETPWLPAGAALLFGVHPLASEPVLYVMARNSGWAAMLMLWATLFALAAYDGARNAARRKTLRVALNALLAAAFWAGAILFKQTALIWPALLFLIWLWRQERPLGRRAFAAGGAVAAVCGLGLLWVIRRGALGGYPVDFGYLATQLVIGADAWFRFLIPHGMNIEHDYLLRESLWSLPVLAALLFHVALIGLGFLWLARRRLAGLAVLWAYAAAMPTNSILARPDLMSDRHLYLFALGGVWALLDAGAYAAMLLRPGIRRKGAATAYTLFACVSIILTAQQVWLFRDRTRLLERAVKLSPNHMRALINLGHQYESAGRAEEAAALYRRCISQWQAGHGRQFPQRHVWASMAWNNLGVIAAARERTDALGNRAARPFFEKALEVDALNGPALDNLAAVCMDEGTYEELLAAAESQLARQPGLTAARLHRGCALAALSRGDEAVEDLLPALDDAACRRVSAPVRARALGALIAMRANPAAQPFEEQAVRELGDMKRAGALPPGRIWAAPHPEAPEPIPRQ